MRTDDFDFDLPEGLIAQQPLEHRDRCRLMTMRRGGGIEHRTFHELPELLRAGDLLVLNDTRVIPARFWARRPSGGRIDGLFLREPAAGRWEVLLKGADRCKVGEKLDLGGAESITLRLVENCGQGRWLLAVEPAMPAIEVLGKFGQTPLPPYIHRSMAAKSGGHATPVQDQLDRDAYQTIYAVRPGAVAAPTAGLHFTPELLNLLAAKGIQHVCVTLHVGMGTFWPVKVDDVKDHRMHAEWYDLPQAAADAINTARRDGRRVVAVGTTVVRVLESAAKAVGPDTGRRDTDGTSPCCDSLRSHGPRPHGIPSCSGWTDIFIYPPFRFRTVDALITNFHLPKSTLLMLVSAFCSPGSTDGMAAIKDAYRQAADLGYRFFSYGDAMLIE